MTKSNVRNMVLSKHNVFHCLILLVMTLYHLSQKFLESVSYSHILTVQWYRLPGRDEFQEFLECFWMKWGEKSRKNSHYTHKKKKKHFIDMHLYMLLFWNQSCHIYSTYIQLWKKLRNHFYWWPLLKAAS